MINDTIEKITEFLFIGKEEHELQNYDLVIVLGTNLYNEPIDILNKFKTKKIINSKKQKKMPTQILTTDDLREFKAELLDDIKELIKTDSGGFNGYD